MSEKIIVGILYCLIAVLFILMIYFFNLGGFAGFLLGFTMLLIMAGVCNFTASYMEENFDNGLKVAVCINIIIFTVTCFCIIGFIFGWFDAGSISSRDSVITTTDDYGKAEAWDIDKDGKLNKREMEQYSRAVQREYDANN
ncbi:MAG: hypothetical protein IJ723_02800 [Ruminococcus sp.]|nr:hypothetical protein [Ruminococcus sp.]